MKKEIVIQAPDDWHVHFRDGALLEYTVKASARHFRRVLAMPNLIPPLTTYHSLSAYHDSIQTVLLDFEGDFKPYLTYYLNHEVTPEDIISSQNQDTDFVLGAKLYPAGVTTNAQQGARDIEDLYPLFEAMQSSRMVLQIHGEVADGDIFDREAIFIERHLKSIIANFPKLRIVLEHISTACAVQFVESASENIAATITPQHLMYNRNQLLSGGIRPHYYCLPILKRDTDQKALQAAATSGNPKFFAGTDSAPHSQDRKECSQGCAGIYSAPHALSLYAEIFEQLDAMDKLNGFMSQFGARFYHLPENQSTIRLWRQPFRVPLAHHYGNLSIVPMHADGLLHWSVV